MKELNYIRLDSVTDSTTFRNWLTSEDGGVDFFTNTLGLKIKSEIDSYHSFVLYQGDNDKNGIIFEFSGSYLYLRPYVNGEKINQSETTVSVSAQGGNYKMFIYYYIINNNIYLGFSSHTLDNTTPKINVCFSDYTKEDTTKGKLYYINPTSSTNDLCFFTSEDTILNRFSSMLNSNWIKNENKLALQKIYGIDNFGKLVCFDNLYRVNIGPSTNTGFTKIYYNGDKAFANMTGYNGWGGIVYFEL